MTLKIEAKPLGQEPPREHIPHTRWTCDNLLERIKVISHYLTTGYTLQNECCHTESSPNGKIRTYYTLNFTKNRRYVTRSTSEEHIDIGIELLVK